MKINNPVCNKIWEDRYQKENETLDENIRRVAQFCSNTEYEKKNFYNNMNNGYFFPAGRTMSNAGIGEKLTLNNCFVLNFVEDDMESIFETVKIGALTHKAGGGTGYDFSRIRPNGAKTNNDAVASGAVSFMKVFDAETSTIMQGSRRGANMGSMNIYHYDIEEFINIKSFDSKILEHFNLSIVVDDEFMRAKDNNEDIWLRYPVYDEYGKIIRDEDKWDFKKKINAKELWDLVMKTAYNTGEIGVLFYDNFNNFNNTSYTETIIATNPCGEYCSGLIFNQELKPSEYKGACNLGSLFLHKFINNPFTSRAEINKEELKKAIKSAVNLLDNIIDKNFFPHQSYKNYQSNMRTIGLGITGFADALAMLGYTYKDTDIADMLMNFITFNAYRASVDLAKTKGAFNFCDNEKIAQSNFIQFHVDNYNTPATDWKSLQEEIKKYGLRNARIISVAPTGTISLSYGENCSSGIEPVFQLEYERKVRIGGQNEEDTQIVTLRDYAYEVWTNMGKPQEYKDIWITALDLPVDAHINMLGTIARHVDMSVSKTINIPTDYPFEDTKEVYDKCHKLGVKGCTIFKPNELRQGILISKDNKSETNEEKTSTLQRGDILCVNDDLLSCKRTVVNGCGKFYVHCDFDEFTGEALETFIEVGSGGGCERNLQFISRLISLLLRAGVPIEEVIDQALSIRPCKAYTDRTKSKGDTSKGTSCASAIGYALKELQTKIHNRCFSDDTDISDEEVEVTRKEKATIIQTDILTESVNKCPECGTELLPDGSCMLCPICGWNKCEAH